MSALQIRSTVTPYSSQQPVAPQALDYSPDIPDVDIESAQHESKVLADTNENSAKTTDEPNGKAKATNDCIEEDAALANEDRRVARTTTITFDPSTERHKEDDALYIPGPRARDRGKLLLYVFDEY